MLFKQYQLKGIKDGDICLAFRRWKKARVKKGSLIKTAVGLIRIDNIISVSESKLKAKDAKDAGYKDIAELEHALARSEGEVFKISVAYHSQDPRIELRNNSKISATEIAGILTKLDRFDKYSNQGNWVFDTLDITDSNENLRAQDLADKLGFEKLWFKTNVRKLKNLGLTISLGVGYSISPRGSVVLKSLKERISER